MKIDPISQSEMDQLNAKLKDAYRKELDGELKSRIESRYSMADMVALTGWTQEYLFRLERDGEIPRAKRVGSRKLFRWSEDQARVILAFRKSREYHREPSTR